MRAKGLVSLDTDLFPQDSKRVAQYTPITANQNRLPQSRMSVGGHLEEEFNFKSLFPAADAEMDECGYDRIKDENLKNEKIEKLGRKELEDSRMGWVLLREFFVLGEKRRRNPRGHRTRAATERYPTFGFIRRRR
jgi:hypothetical protein